MLAPGVHIVKEILAQHVWSACTRALRRGGLLLMGAATLVGCAGTEDQIETAPPSGILQTAPADTRIQERIVAVTPGPSCAYVERDFSVFVHGAAVRGTVCVPDAPGPIPLIIASHGLGSTSLAFQDYAKSLCPLGYALCSFDFRGGSIESASDGDTREMSVLTELDDLTAVLADARTWPFVDPDKIVLLGASQGGLVSAMCAARQREEIAALILLFPAFVIPDMVRTEFPYPEDIPDEHQIIGFFPGGRPYAEDIYDYDPFGEIGRYGGPVLILYGDADALVPLEYSQRAAVLYPGARLEVIEDAGHGFYGRSLKASIHYIETFLETVSPPQCTDAS